MAADEASARARVRVGSRAHHSLYTADPTCELPAQALFPQMLRVVRRFMKDKVDPGGRTDRRDVFLEPYFSWAVEALVAAVTPGDGDSAEVPRYEAHRGNGSTRDVDFWTSKPVREASRCDLNYVVSDTERWEQTAAFYLDTDPHVVAFVKNFNLGFAIPYTPQRGEPGIRTGFSRARQPPRPRDRHANSRDQGLRSAHSDQRSRPPTDGSRR